MPRLSGRCVLACAYCPRRSPRARIGMRERRAERLDVAIGIGCRIAPRPFGCRRHPTARQNILAVPASAASAASPSIASVGTRTCGMPAQMRAQPGTRVASRRGGCGRRQARMTGCCENCNYDDVRRPDADFGRLPRSTTPCRCFASGESNATSHGRRCSAIGAYQTFKSSIATCTQRNAPSRRIIAANVRSAREQYEQEQQGNRNSQKPKQDDAHDSLLGYVLYAPRQMTPFQRPSRNEPPSIAARLAEKAPRNSESVSHSKDARANLRAASA